MRTPTVISVSVVFATSLIVLRSQAQTLGPRSLERQAGELNHLQAASRGPQIFALARRPDEGASKYRCTLLLRGILGQKVHIWEVRVGDRVLMSLESRTGLLLHYYDSAKNIERSRKQGRTGALIVQDTASAKVKARSMLTQLGVPTSWTMRNFEFYKDNEGPKKRASYFSCGLYDVQNEVAGSIYVDAQDGRLISFVRAP